MANKSTTIHNEKQLTERIRSVLADFIRQHGKHECIKSNTDTEYVGTYKVQVLKDNIPPMKWHNEWVIAVQMDMYRDDRYYIGIITDPSCQTWSAIGMRGLGCDRSSFDLLDTQEQVTFTQMLIGTYALTDIFTKQ